MEGVLVEAVDTVLVAIQVADEGLGKHALQLGCSRAAAVCVGVEGVAVGGTTRRGR